MIAYCDRSCHDIFHIFKSPIGVTGRSCDSANRYLSVGQSLVGRRKGRLFRVVLKLFLFHFQIFLFQPAEHGELSCEPRTRAADDGSRPKQTPDKLIWPWEAEDQLISVEYAADKLNPRFGEVPWELRPGKAELRNKRFAKWALPVEKRDRAQWSEVGWELTENVSRVNCWSDCASTWSKQKLQIWWKLCWMCSLNSVSEFHKCRQNFQLIFL